MNGKHLIFIALCIPLLSRAQSINIIGSDTMFPFVKDIAELYCKSNPKHTISVSGGGSGTGLIAMKDEVAELAIASRHMKLNETQALEEKGIALREVIIAYDALSIIVNPKNPIKKITLSQIKDVFTGKISNWKHLGGKDQPIKVYTRNPNSGTYEFIKKKILLGNEYSANSGHKNKNEEMVNAVFSEENAIGFCGLSYLRKGVRPLKVGESNRNYVKPNFQNAKDGIYPISRPLYYFYEAKNEKLLNSFIDFSLSHTGQALIHDEGYVPIEEKVINAEFDEDIEALFNF